MKAKRSGLRIDHADASVAIVLLLVFVARWVLSDNQSYWLDELLSVSTYGVDNRTAKEVVKRLAHQSVHPPLYQLILFYWMKLAGDSEVSTRMLSNIYVTGASVCMYLTARNTIGRRRSLIALIAFSLMYVPFYYALETRSYGQTLFLSTLSSMALFHIMRFLAAGSGWKQTLLSRACLVLVAANLGLLMTHYYNFYFLVSQGAFLLAWSVFRAWRIRRDSFARIFGEIAKAALPLFSAFVLFLAVWGPNMARTYRSRSGQFTTNGDIQNPFYAFWNNALEPNFREIPLVLLGFLAAFLLAFYCNQAMAAWKGTRAIRVGKPAFAVYALFTAFLPFVAAYTSFLYSGHERWYARYFSFTSPSLAILLPIAIEQTVQTIDRVTRHSWFSRHYIDWSALYAVIAVILVFPGTHAAATRPKADWRGTARLISDITTGDPDHKYIVYSTGFGPLPNLNYYFKRFGTDIRVRGVIRFRAERRHHTPFSKRKYRNIRKHDFLILTFTHLRTSRFPRTLASLSSQFTVHQYLIHDGRGVIIYRVR